MAETNRLIHETSPYLLEHASNPVDWYPWGKNAIETARRENKPILLSIGYSACHWCHVMAHESFEDNATAGLMNQLFINIKVDREERPDLDKIYQTAHHLLNQRAGGWPLTVFLDAEDLTPFFSGTYYPREARFNLPAFKDVLRTIADLYKNHRTEIKKQNYSLKTILNTHHTTSDDAIELNKNPIYEAVKSLKHQYDITHGGFGTAPKFPQPVKLDFLIQHHPSFIIATLIKMAKGGIYDQLRGGFFRYSVDAAWQIPHFEKMLYDNAQLICLYSYAANQFNETCFEHVALQTAHWIITEMQSPEGGYYASLNADSEGIEGKFYIWQLSDIKKIIDSDEYTVIKNYFGLNQPPNFENQWHFHIATPIQHIAEKLNITDAEAISLLESAKIKLLNHAKNRIPPTCDKKILTAWNALMIKAMGIASISLQDANFSHSAQKALIFIKQKLWKNERLHASYKDEKVVITGYLDDYAFLLDAVLTLLQITWDIENLYFAIKLADQLLEYFYDKINGGFFFTAHDQETVLYRPKILIDEVTPSGNAIAVQALLTLGDLLGETRYLQAAEKSLKFAWPKINEYPSDHCGMLKSLNQFLDPIPILVIRGSINEIESWKKLCRDSISDIHIFAIPKSHADLPGLLNNKQAKTQTTAYFCRGTECHTVIESKNDLIKLIKTLRF